MNIKDILSSDEQLLFKAQQHRLVPGGKEITPSEIFVTTKRVVMETPSWLGLKKEFQDLHYSDIESVTLKKNILSADLVIKSRFQGEVHISAIGKRDAETMEQMISENVNNYRYGGGAASRSVS